MTATTPSQIFTLIHDPQPQHYIKMKKKNKGYIMLINKEEKLIININH